MYNKIIVTETTEEAKKHKKSKGNIPTETKLLKFCQPNISNIMFLVSDKNVVFVFGVRFTFLFDSKNSRAQE